MKGLDFASVIPGDVSLDEEAVESESEEETQDEPETNSDTDEEEEEDEEVQDDNAFEAKDFVPIGEEPKVLKDDLAVKADAPAESDEIPGFVKKSGLANTENATITVRFRPG
jgi:hypothetical protein